MLLLGALLCRLDPPGGVCACLACIEPRLANCVRGRPDKGTLPNLYSYSTRVLTACAPPGSSSHPVQPVPSPEPYFSLSPP